MLDPIDFTIDDVRYKAKRMDGFVQADVLALISPLITAGGADLLPWIMEMRAQAVAKGAGAILDLRPEQALAHFGGVTREIAKMTSEDRRFILTVCLSLVDKEIAPNNWKAIWISAAGQAADSNLQNDLLLMLRITGAVLQGTFSRFFPASL